MVFRIKIFPDGDGFHAKVSGLPGCGTWGKTKEEALTNIREAVEVYFAPEEDEEVEILEEAFLEEVVV